MVEQKASPAWIIPLIFLGIGPGYSFLITQRFLHIWQGTHELFSAALTSLVILLIILAASLPIGIKNDVLIQLPIMLIAGAMGVWLFYVQHQFEGVYWSRQEEWDPLWAALKGSSYYKLPSVLQWFSGHFGLHYVHHVLPWIPNYKLQPCYDASPEMQEVPPLTFCKSLKSFHLNLWDEKEKRLVSFKSLREPAA